MVWEDWPYVIKGGFIGALVGMVQVFLSFFDLGCPGGECSLFKKLFIWLGSAGFFQCSILGDVCRYTIGPVLVVLELTAIGAIIGGALSNIRTKRNSSQTK